MNPDLVWIQTKDGSPTLWNEKIGQSFRSNRGAFLESWRVFVEPALNSKNYLKSQQKFQIVEFGLGAGTNWFLFSLLDYLIFPDSPSTYIAVEKDLSAFEMGFKKWMSEGPRLIETTFSRIEDSPFKDKSLHSDDILFSIDQRKPKVFESIEDLARNLPNIHANAWFHDPFGIDVNPEGYSSDVLQKARRFFKSQTRGYSYACNARFKNSLTQAGFCYETLSTDPNQLLKRERLTFRLSQAF